jgi:diphthamide synthase (EF-2-diphthine--ammonia ligase)
MMAEKIKTKEKWFNITMYFEGGNIETTMSDPEHLIKAWKKKKRYMIRDEEGGYFCYDLSKFYYIMIVKKLKEGGKK